MGCCGQKRSALRSTSAPMTTLASPQRAPSSRQHQFRRVSLSSPSMPVMRRLFCEPASFAGPPEEGRNAS